MKTLISLGVALVVAAPLSAQGWIEPLPAIRCDCALLRTRTAVSVQVTGRVARVQVEEWFQNRGVSLGEGDYLYPLPGEAVFTNFSLFQGDQELTGETMDAARARQIYEEIVRKKRDPALIELVGHGLIRARVFPINPGETRKITLRYTQLLGRAGEALQFRYTTGRVFDRTPIDLGREVARAIERAPFTFELTADSAEAFRDPFSPTHEVRVERAQGRIVVRPVGSLAGDFALFLPLARGTVGLTLATHRPSGEDGYFMLTLSPGSASGATQPRDVTAVVDVSGSMSGTKMTQARAALSQLLRSLDRSDRFRLISFSGGVSAYRDGWTGATDDEVRRAAEWVERLTADGGTNIAGALTEAFRHASPDDRLPIVLFLTDGLPSVGEQNPERIASQAEQARGRARVFAFGVGYDVNTYLLDRLTAAGRGATQFVQSDGEIEGAIGGLVTKISQPVLTDLEIADASSLREIYPARLPDLFAGEDLVAFGRYAGTRARGGTIVITGRRKGRTERFTLDANLPDHETGNDFIPRLWASRKIGVLSRTLRIEGPNPGIEREIRETALRYGIVSAYTSYLVQEPMVAQRAQLGRPMLDRAAPAPTQASGQAAVAAAAEARRMREAKSVAELDAVAGAGSGERGAVRSDVRRVAGRVFELRNGRWTDLAAGDTLRTVTLEPYGAAYFRLLAALPELKPYFSAFERVVVAGSRVRIGVGAGGLEQISAAELDRVVREFRGR
ncbi:MAG: VWA domain-containing protein [Gemmatimonadetes bacterium]|nr:VWA domain-containing protein [Gemmatimonadota bacterium]